MIYYQFFPYFTPLGKAIEDAKRNAKEYHGVNRPICEISNHLNNSSKVIAGHDIVSRKLGSVRIY